MASSASLDANVLLDWLLERDINRLNQANNLFAASPDLHVSDLTISEVVFILEGWYKLPRDIVVANLSRILNEEVINCNRLLIRKAAMLYEQEPKLSWVDCCAVFYAELNNALPLYTSDNDLIKRSAGKAQAIPS